MAGYSQNFGKIDFLKKGFIFGLTGALGMRAS
jgi:hypothetical protein